MSVTTRVAGHGAIDGRTFVLRDGAWTDIRFKPEMKKTVIKPFSKAYFDVIAQLPELRAVFALGQRVIVVGKASAIELNDNGVSELDAVALARAW